jgi:predicted SAM-dependent methyltransferase
LGIKARRSNEIFAQIKKGNYENKPGWVRISLHATMKMAEIDYIAGAVNEISHNKDFFLHQYTDNDLCV